MVPKQCPLLRSTFWYLICCATCFKVREIIPKTLIAIGALFFLVGPDAQRGPNCLDVLFCRFPHIFLEAIIYKNVFSL